MRDEDLERLLQRYEPAGPPASLRARALGARDEAERAWPWAVAAAALLAMTVWLHGARTLGLPARANANTQPLDGEEALLADMLGGTDDARAMARTIVALDAAQQDASAVATTGITGEER